MRTTTTTTTVICQPCKKRSRFFLAPNSCSMRMRVPLCIIVSHFERRQSLRSPSCCSVRFRPNNRDSSKYGANLRRSSQGSAGHFSSVLPGKPRHFLKGLNNEDIINKCLIFLILLTHKRSHREGGLQRFPIQLDTFCRCC